MLVWIPTVVALWLAVGTFVAAPFLVFAVGGVVDGAKGSSAAFRLMMLPGAALLWPLLLRRWITSRTPDQHA